MGLVPELVLGMAAGAGVPAALVAFSSVCAIVEVAGPDDGTGHRLSICRSFKRMRRPTLKQTSSRRKALRGKAPPAAT